MPAESFEELFQIAKEASESEEKEDVDSVEKEFQENEAETSSEVKGNYSRVSADKLWKDIK